MSKKKHRIQSVIDQHEASGKYVSVDGLQTFALSYGRGETVLCIHGVPTSSFLYRKILSSLSRKGYRGLSIDLPGLGLSDRPENFEYTFSAFANFLHRATTLLKIKKFHLVVHDIGGPIGFALAARHPQQVLSLTILNTWIDVVKFKKPLVMRPFEKPLMGEAELKMISHMTWPLMFKGMGVLDPDCVPLQEINAYVDLLKRKDGGKAFLKIMRNFDQSPEFRELCYRAVQDVNYPVQAIWGEKDMALTVKSFGQEIKEVSGIKEIHTLPSKHFLQEEVWLSIADKIVDQAKSIHLQTH